MEALAFESEIQVVKDGFQPEGSLGVKLTQAAPLCFGSPVASFGGK